MRKDTPLNSIIKVEDSENLLQSVFSTDLIAISVLQAIRDKHGNVVDFVIKIVNNELELQTGRTDLVGKIYGVEYPEIKEMGLFDLMLEVMNTGKRGQMEYFYNIEGVDAWFCSTFVKIEDGLVASNLDISKLKKAEEERVNMVIDQNKKIYWATLDIQEIERKRIAENLHNSVGQLLFGVKMNLLQDFNRENLTTDQLFEQIEDITFKTNKLLDDAIKETRRISHELTPAILEDFGLREAVEDICSQFRHVLEINCKVSGLLNNINKPMEVAVYRIIQELTTNIIKHAKASKAFCSIDIDHINITMIVSDNGVGFEKKGKSDGIGLKTIQNKINLLNGSFTLESNKGQDNRVTIILPYEHL